MVEYIDSEHDESHGMDEASLKEHEEWTKVKVCTSSTPVADRLRANLAFFRM